MDGSFSECFDLIMGLKKGYVMSHGYLTSIGAKATRSGVGDIIALQEARNENCHNCYMLMMHGLVLGFCSDDLKCCRPFMG